MRIRSSYIVASSLALFLLVFLVVPVFKVVYVAFQDPATGALTLVNFIDFFKTSLFQESFINSFYVAGMAVLLATILALPLAYFTTRFNFGGSILIQTLGIVPLIMPPFVGAVAMQLFFGSNGSINLLLDQWFGINIPFMEEAFKPSPPLVPAMTVLLMVIILLVMPQGLFGRKE